MHHRAKGYVAVFVFCAFVVVIANFVILRFVNQSEVFEGIPSLNMRSTTAPVNFDEVTGSPEFVELWKEWRELPESKKVAWLSEPKIEYMEGYLDLVAVSDASISEEDFEKWVVHGFGYAEGDRVPVPKDEINALKTDAVMFDCRPFVLDNELKVAIQNAPNLTWLRLSEEFQEEDLVLLTGLKQLEGLSLKGVKFGNGDLRWLAGFENLKWIEIEPGELNKFLLPSLPELHFLHLAGRGIGDQHLPLADQFPNLKSLEVDSSEVTDNGVAIIAKNCPGLVTLDLGWCDGITYDCVRSLAQLTDLRYLYVNHTPLERQASGFKYRTIPELQIKLPKCHIRIGER